MDWLDELVKKIKEEFNNNEKGLHIGEYVAFNLTNLAVNVAKKSGQTNLAKKIESKREDFLEFGRNIDNKVREEYKQYQESDGFSQYVAENVVSLAGKGARLLNQDELAEKIEARRQDILDVAEKVDDKVKEEYKQYQESDGFSQYVAWNMVSLAGIGARLLNQDELAEKIEAKRQDVLDVAEKVDDKVREEYKQYLESDGFSQYVAENVVSLAGIGARLLNQDELAEKFEGERQNIVDMAKKVDDRVKEEYEKLKEGKFNEEKNNEIPEVKSVEPLYKQDDKLSYSELKVDVAPNETKYNKVEIKELHNENDGSMGYLCYVDGKLHGAKAKVNNDGEIIGLSLYNHGKMVDMGDKKINFIMEEKDGLKHNFLLVDDNKFGWESFSDKDGNIKVAIFDEGMKTDCQFRDVSYSVDVFSKDALRDEIRKQKGEEQKLGGQYAVSKTKCAINLNKKSYEVNNEENLVDKKNMFEKRVEDKNKINPCFNVFNRDMK